MLDYKEDDDFMNKFAGMNPDIDWGRVNNYSDNSDDEEEEEEEITTTTLPRLPDEIWHKIISINYDQEKAIKDDLRRRWSMHAEEANKHIKDATTAGNQISNRIRATPWGTLYTDMNNYVAFVWCRVHPGYSDLQGLNNAERLHGVLTNAPYRNFGPGGHELWHKLDLAHNALIKAMRRYIHADQELHGKRMSKLPRLITVGMMRICLKEEI